MTQLFTIILSFTLLAASLTGCDTNTSTPAPPTPPISQENTVTEPIPEPEEMPAPPKGVVAKPTPTPSPATPSPGLETDFSALADLDNTSKGWGQGNSVDELNRPKGATDYQDRYGNYGADFIRTNTQTVYLTMDEGYENGYTATILDVLKEKQCPAVFFVTMDYVKNEPELVQRMIDEGHVLGNHSTTHPSKGLPSLSLEKQAKEIIQLHQYVKEQFNYEMSLFRYPAGIFSAQSLALVEQLGYHSVFWSFAYQDWVTDNQPDPAEALTKLGKKMHPGAIYLLHAVSKTNTAILGDFIDQTREAGYEFGLYTDRTINNSQPGEVEER